MHCRGKDPIDCPGRFRFELRRVNLRLKDSAVRVLGDQFKRVKDRLSPGRTAWLREYRANHVDKLRETSGFDPVRVI